MTPEEMRAVVPSAVLSVCETLRSSGFEAWIVGGAVRDLVLGKTPSDWDVASDALPEDVLGVFDKTIATGMQHGTVTAVVGRGRQREQVEITSFRGEGAYTDSRRPDEVHFGVPLDEDLLRRDFVINAMAYDPLQGVIHDPLGGVADLQAGLLRAVGSASERFNEDGLRVMRAVRFVSTLDFAMDAETEKGLGTALKPLSKVAQERVRVELLKLLAGKAPVRGLDIAQQNGILDVILPELKAIDAHKAFERVKQGPQDAILRFAILLQGVAMEAVESLLRRLRMSNEDRQRMVAILRYQDEFSSAVQSNTALRIHLSQVGRKAAADHVTLVEVMSRQREEQALVDACQRARHILRSGDALEVRDLAIGGGELMKVTSAKGKAVGELLAFLLQRVLKEPELNTAEALQEMAIARNS